MKVLRLLPILFVASCATLDQTPAELEVTIEHISAPQLQVLESRAVVSIRIDNESAEPITVLGGVHHIHVNGRRIGKALDSEGAEVPAFSSVTRQLPLMVSNLGVIRSTRETIDSKDVSYRLESRLSIATTSGKRKCSLRREGEVTLDELLPAASRTPSLTPVPLVP